MSFCGCQMHECLLRLRGVCQRTFRTETWWVYDDESFVHMGNVCASSVCAWIEVVGGGGLSSGAGGGMYAGVLVQDVLTWSQLAGGKRERAKECQNAWRWSYC